MLSDARRDDSAALAVLAQKLLVRREITSRLRGTCEDRPAVDEES
jgi:hypothetical protein